MKRTTAKSAFLPLLPGSVLAVIYNLGGGLLISSANEWWLPLEFGALYVDILFFYVIIQLVNFLRRNNPAKSFDNNPLILVAQRIGLTSLIIVLINPFVLELKVITGSWYTYISYGQIATYNLVAILLMLIYVIVDLGYELLDRWRTSEAEKERFSRLHAQAQLENLKAQVNPHFLFNSLNTLSSLITEDEMRAKQFVRQLSAVYRYILENRERELVSLKKEKDLFDAYIYLCEMRFEESFSVSESWPDEVEKYQIPPMTLQILVENAIKHNIISKQKPLLLAVESTPNKLIIRNTFQPKKQLETGTGFGLNNVKERFAQLTQSPILVDHTNGHFSVELPLIRTDKK